VIHLRRSLLIVYDSVLVYPGLRAATANEPIPIYMTTDQVSDDIVCREDKLVVMYRGHRHLSLWTSRMGLDTGATKIEIGPLQPPYALVCIHPHQDILLVASLIQKPKTTTEREGCLFPNGLSTATVYPRGRSALTPWGTQATKEWRSASSLAPRPVYKRCWHSP
jgi:hypothetical protein